MVLEESRDNNTWFQWWITRIFRRNHAFPTSMDGCEVLHFCWLMIHLNIIPLGSKIFSNYWKLWNYNPNPNYCPNPNWLRSRCLTVSNPSQCSGAAVQLPNLTVFDAGISKPSRMPCLPCLLVDFPREMWRKVMILPPKSWGFLGSVSSNLSINRSGKQLRTSKNRGDFVVLLRLRIPFSVALELAVYHHLQQPWNKIDP